MERPSPRPLSIDECGAFKNDVWRLRMRAAKLRDINGATLPGSHFLEVSAAAQPWRRLLCCASSRLRLSACVVQTQGHGPRACFSSSRIRSPARTSATSVHTARPHAAEARGTRERNPERPAQSLAVFGGARPKCGTGAWSGRAFNADEMLLAVCFRFGGNEHVH